MIDDAETYISAAIRKAALIEGVLRRDPEYPMEALREALANVVAANEYLTRTNLIKAFEFPNADTPIKAPGT